MSDHDQFNIPDLPPLPDDPRDKKGRRIKDTADRRQRWKHLRADVFVAQEHIDEACRKDSHTCMIAQAIKEQIPGAKNVVVDIQTIRWTDTLRNRRIVCFTPLPAQRGLVAFDRGIVPQPFAFVVEPMQITQTRAQIKEEGRVIPRIEKAPQPRGPKAEKRKLRAPQGGEKGTPPSSGGGRYFNDIVVMGGKEPIQHHASRHRTYGIRGYTEDDVA